MRYHRNPDKKLLLICSPKIRQIILLRSITIAGFGNWTGYAPLYDYGAVVRNLKTHFARYGSSCQLVSDNGPHFVAAEL